MIGQAGVGAQVDYSALGIARCLLARAHEEDELLSHLKLQKLLYFCQGFTLAMTGKPLFSEAIVAWEHGPVVREVWDEYRTFGGHGIDRPADVPIVEPTVDDTLDDVWNAYGQFSAWRLREISHATPPWRDVPRNSVISLDAMQQYFTTQLTA